MPCQAYSGVFHLLPLGLRVQNKLEALVDKHMSSIGNSTLLSHRTGVDILVGASKVSLASITSEKLWRKSGRYTGNNPEVSRPLAIVPAELTLRS